MKNAQNPKQSVKRKLLSQPTDPPPSKKSKSNKRPTSTATPNPKKAKNPPKPKKATQPKKAQQTKKVGKPKKNLPNTVVKLAKTTKNCKKKKITFENAFYKPLEPLDENSKKIRDEFFDNLSDNDD